MKYLKPQPIPEPSEMTESATNSPNRERIAGGFNAYDNILKLVNIEEITINIPEITPDEVPEVGYTAYYSTDSFFDHNVGQTPFVEVEWRDISSVGSGGAYLELYNLSVDYNQRQIRYTFTFDFSDTTGSGAPSPFPARSLTIRFYIFKLNTKRRLDTYIK